jgi:transketolase
MANAIRALSMDAVEKAKSGHPGMPMGMADVATVLFTRHLKYDAKAPRWADRDRFVLSAGHGSMLLYSLFYLTGYEDITLDDIQNFRQLHRPTAGHPEFGELAGIETTTGPLGQGIANAVGMALAERMMNAQFGNDLVDHYTYVIAGDGCLMEGISQEAISLAGHLKLNRLIVLWDDNQISIDGPTSLCTSEDVPARFVASGWQVESVDGHDMAAVDAALERARQSDKPVMIACRTTIAYGAPTKAGSEKSHGSPLGAEEIAGTRAKLGWSHAAFEVPDNLLSEWRKAGVKGQAERAAWEGRLKASSKGAEFERRMAGRLPQNWRDVVVKLKDELAKTPVKEATRQSSQRTLEILAPVLPELAAGSADLTGSNNTRTKGMQPLSASNYGGNYIFYGVREHGMAAAMNGMALHGGLVPYGGTFLVFTDYCRPSIRLSALMKQRVIYVMTHDSIGLGEDGPTHQPVEHLSALRVIPNLKVFRPADAIETAECWELALSNQHGPAVLALTRQALPQQRTDGKRENRSAMGGYILREVEDELKGIVIGTGSELHLASQAVQQLGDKAKHVRVVSMPSLELFFEQPEDYQQKLLPDNIPVVAVEAASRQSWDRLLGRKGQFIGMKGFGASAPAEVLYPHFGITVEAVADALKNVL